MFFSDNIKESITYFHRHCLEEIKQTNNRWIVSLKKRWKNKILIPEQDYIIHLASAPPQKPPYTNRMHFTCKIFARFIVNHTKSDSENTFITSFHFIHKIVAFNAKLTKREKTHKNVFLSWCNNLDAFICFCMDTTCGMFLLCALNAIRHLSHLASGVRQLKVRRHFLIFVTLVPVVCVLVYGIWSYEVHHSHKKM